MMRLARPFAPRAAAVVLVTFAITSLVATPLANALRASSHPLAADVILGTRWTLLATGGVLGIALPVALVLGSLAGFAAWPNALLARLVELSGALPTVVFVAVIQAIESAPSMRNLILVLGALRGIGMARLLRSEGLRTSGQEFVTAARALGLPARVVLVRHVLPHVLSPVLVSAAFTAAAVVALESALSFLGLGLPAGQASWGVLLGRLTGPAVLGPTLGILALCGALYVLADGLDEALSASPGTLRALRFAGK